MYWNNMLMFFSRRTLYLNNESRNYKKLKIISNHNFFPAHPIPQTLEPLFLTVKTTGALPVYAMQRKQLNKRKRELIQIKEQRSSNQQAQGNGQITIAHNNAHPSESTHNNSSRLPRTQGRNSQIIKGEKIKRKSNYKDGKGIWPYT